MTLPVIVFFLRARTVQCAIELNICYVAGIGIDNPASDGMNLIKKRGKVKALEDEINSCNYKINY